MSVGRFDNDVRNYCRSKSGYSGIRHQLAQLILANHKTVLAPLGQYLRNDTFLINPSDTSSYSFNRKDLPTLSRLRYNRSAAVDTNYLALLRDYVIANKARVERMCSVSDAMSRSLLNVDNWELGRELEEVDAADRASMFAYRSYCAFDAHSASAVRSHLRDNLHSPWLKGRLLFPLLYYYINKPSDSQLTRFLAYLIPDGVLHADIEREIIRLLLSDETCAHMPVAFKCYVALMGHPYDALEFFLTHCELLFCTAGGLPSRELDIFNSIGTAIDCHRVNQLRPIFNSQPLPFQDRPSTPQVAIDFKLDETAASALMSIIDLSPDTTSPTANLGPLLNGVATIFNTRYPTFEDFSSAEQNLYLYRFTSAGRLCSALLRNLYIFARETPEIERLHFLRLAAIYGYVTPGTYAGPGCEEVLSG